MEGYIGELLKGCEDLKRTAPTPAKAELFQVKPGSSDPLLDGSDDPLVDRARVGSTDEGSGRQREGRLEEESGRRRKGRDLDSEKVS
jgi:hypothetical protein